MRIKDSILLVIFLFAVCSCGGGGRLDAEFERIDHLCDSVPKDAISALDSIDWSSLSERDRNRFDLLSIKSRDKAFIVHSSDSLILGVIDYYDKHRSEGLYAEALYYGGRVYSDIGDLPTAIEFFLKSLDEIPEDDLFLRFRRNVLDQTGRALHNLRLDSAAINYLQQSLLINIPNTDEYYEKAFTHGLLAGSYKNQKDLKNAHRHINKALNLSYFLNETEQQDIQAEFAEMLLYEGKIDSALMVIRPIPAKADFLSQPYCLAVAAEIYKDAGILDTAYMYARKLTRLKTPSNKKTGYKVIFSNELKNYVSRDTLMKLMPEYKQTVEDYLDTHEAEQAIIQNSQYNYRNQVRAKEKAEAEFQYLKTIIWIIGCGFAVILFSAIIVVLWRKYRRSRKDSQLMEGYILTERLKEEVEQSRLISEVENRETSDLAYSIKAKDRILEDIETLKKNDPYGLVNNKFLESPLYMKLKENVENKEDMCKDVTWTQIENLIKSVSPDFDLYLNILTQHQISGAERKVAMLIKLGFSNTQIADLLNRQPATVSRQRTSIAGKIGCDKSAVDSMLVRL